MLCPQDVLVIPRRPVPRIADLTPPELAALMSSVQTVGQVVERAYAAHGLTVACQDGPAAGQSVPHVHFHVIPRKAAGDRFSGARNDDVYPALEKAEHELGAGALKMDAEEDRKPRSMEDMEREAAWLRTFFEEFHDDGRAES